KGHGGQTLVGNGGPCPDPCWRDGLRRTEAPGRKANHKTADATVANQKVRPDTDHEHRNLFRDGSQEGRQIFLILRLEQGIGRAAGAEPRHRIHADVWREPPAQTRQAVTQTFDEILSGTHPSSSFGSAYAHWVMLPAPRNTT